MVRHNLDPVARLAVGAGLLVVLLSLSASAGDGERMRQPYELPDMGIQEVDDSRDFRDASKEPVNNEVNRLVPYFSDSQPTDNKQIVHPQFRFFF